MFFKKLLVLFALAGCMRSNVFAVATAQHPMSGTVQTVQSHYPVLIEPLGGNLYKIKTGAKIWSIAKEFYGDSSRWVDVVYQNMWLFDRMWIDKDNKLYADIQAGEFIILDCNYHHPGNGIPVKNDVTHHQQHTTFTESDWRMLFCFIAIVFIFLLYLQRDKNRKLNDRIFHLTEEMNKNSASTFNWQEETIKIINKSLDEKTPIFLEVSTDGGSKYKFDSINNRPQKDKAN